MKADANLLSSSQAARRIGVSKQQLHQYRHAGLISPSLVTAGGHCRFAESEIERFTKAHRGDTRSDFEPDLHYPLDIRSLFTHGIAESLPPAFKGLDQFKEQKNVVSIKCDLATEEIEVTFSTRSLSRCPARSVERSGESAIVLSISLDHTLSYAQALESALSCYDESLASAQFVLRKSHEILHSSSHLSVQAMRQAGWFWVWVKEHPFVLRLPKDPTKEEWETYATKCVMAYQALSERSFSAPPFSFLKGPSEKEI